MLSKISSRIGHYSHIPGNVAKNHKTQRLLHTKAKANSRLAQLTQDCMSDLRKLKATPALQTTMNELKQLYYLDLQLLAEADYQALPDHAIFEPDSSEHAKERAQANQLARGVGAVAALLESYAIHAPGMTLVDAIGVAHRDYLLSAFHGGFRKLCLSDQIALTSVIRPDVLCTLGIPCPSEGKRLSIANQKLGTPQLDENHIFALADYCSSQTGHFNAINDSKRVWQLCGIDNLAVITSFISAPLDEALRILSMHKAFVYEGPAWKGIALMTPEGPYRLSKIQPGMEYTSPHWSSVTRKESESYNNKGDYRSSKLHILHAQGVRVHMFNDSNSIDECEVMLPPKPMYFIEGAEKRTSAAGAATHVYCTMKPDQSEADNRTKEPHAIRV